MDEIEIPLKEGTIHDIIHLLETNMHNEWQYANTMCTEEEWKKSYCSHTREIIAELSKSLDGE